MIKRVRNTIKVGNFFGEMAVSKRGGLRLASALASTEVESWREPWSISTDSLSDMPNILPFA